MVNNSEVVSNERTLQVRINSQGLITPFDPQTLFTPVSFQTCYCPVLTLFLLLLAKLIFLFRFLFPPLLPSAPILNHS
jgi:hypothetical protein